MRRWIGTHISVIGPAKARLHLDGSEIVCGESGQPKKLDRVLFDIMIDDGLHDVHANICFFIEAVQKLKPGGIYIVEDIRPNDAAVMEAFVRSIPHLGKYATVLPLFHLRNGVDNRLMLFQKA